MPRIAKSFDAELIQETKLAGIYISAIRIYRDDRTGSVKPFELWSVSTGVGHVRKDGLTRCSSFKTLKAAITKMNDWTVSVLNHAQECHPDQFREHVITKRMHSYGWPREKASSF